MTDQFAASGMVKCNQFHGFDSDVPQVHFSFTWEIVGFPWLPQKNGDSLASPYFTAPGHDGAWYIRLYPRGYHPADHEHVSLFLHYVGGSKVDTLYSLSLRSDSQSKGLHALHTSARQFDRNDNWGCSRFITRQTLVDALTQPTSIATLHIDCRVHIYGHVQVVLC